MNLIKAVLDGQAGLDRCREAMGEALCSDMIRVPADQMHAQVGHVWRRMQRIKPGRHVMSKGIPKSVPKETCFSTVY